MNASTFLATVDIVQTNFESALVTHQRNGNRGKIESLNQELRQLANELDVYVIDLNNVIAPEGILLERYTTDGIHLSGEAYEVWYQRVAEAILR